MRVTSHCPSRRLSWGTTTWCVSAELSNSLAKDIKEYWNWEKPNCYKAKNTGGPINPQPFVHDGRKHWKSCAEQCPYYSIGSEGTVCIHSIIIYDVGLTLEKDTTSKSAVDLRTCTIENTYSMIPTPSGIPAKACGTHKMLGSEVHANQRSPIGKHAPPTIIGRSRCSGGR